MPSNIPPWLLPSDPSIEPPDASPNFYIPSNLPPGVTTFPQSGPYTPPMNVPLVQPPGIPDVQPQAVQFPGGVGDGLPPYMFTFTGAPDQNPYYDPGFQQPPSTPGPYQPGIDISQNPFSGGDPGNAPFAPGTSPFYTIDPNGPGIPAPGSSPFPQAPQGESPFEVVNALPYDPSQPQGQPGPVSPGGTYYPPQSGFTTFGPWAAGGPGGYLGGSPYQMALFHGTWGGHQPMDFATWNAGAGTPQAWASRPGGTYQNYLNIWHSLRAGGPSAPPARGTVDGSGQGPGGAGRPMTASR